MAAPLFRSLLGAEFEKLDPRVQRVHDGEARVLQGAATVERGSSLIARALCVLGSLPAEMSEAPIEVQIALTGAGERWTRFFGDSRPMRSSLHRRGRVLVEELGPAALRFQLRVHEAGLQWILVRISVLGIPLPVGWFVVAAKSDARDARYHFSVELAVRGIGRIVRYEGLLDAGG